MTTLTKQKGVIASVRKKAPLIHHLTNKVVMNFTANGLLSFGGIPAMADAPEEAADMAKNAQALLINIGTIQEAELEAMILAGREANKGGIPVVFDPVGAPATPFRQKAVERILANVHPTLIKGNAGEMAFLVDIPWEMKGPDSIGGGNVENIAVSVAEKYDTAVVITGREDVFCYKNILLKNDSGDALLTKVTGAGCLLGSVLASCLTTEHLVEEQVMAGLYHFGLAAEYARKRVDMNGPGSFQMHFLDALSYEISVLQGD